MEMSSEVDILTAIFNKSIQILYMCTHLIHVFCKQALKCIFILTEQSVLSLASFI